MQEFESHSSFVGRSRSHSVATLTVGVLAAIWGATLCPPADAQTGIAGWGYRVFDSRWTTASFLDVSAGQIFTVGVLSNGELAAWGSNYPGMCNVPAPGPGLTFVAVSAGWDHALALRNDGIVVGWGNNLHGKATSPGGAFTQVAAGNYHSIGLRPNGRVDGWGWNAFGQAQTQFPPNGTVFVQIAAKEHFSLARRSDGQVIAWGQNSAGQCNVPALPTGVTYTDIAAGGTHSSCHSLGLRSDGTVIGWGNNSYGQLDVPTPPTGVTYVDVAAGDNFSLAKRSDGQVVSWGAAIAVPGVSPGAVIPQITASGGHGVLRRANGQLLSFGSNYWFESNAPVLPAGVSWVQVSAGSDHTLALRSDGVVRGWGRNNLGECNAPTLAAGLIYTAVEAGFWGSGGLVSDGSFRLWGSYNALNFSAPPTPGQSHTKLALGRSHVASLLDNGEIVAWGSNTLGQCNVLALPAGVTYVGVEAGWDHTVALRSDGLIVGWGDNARGQLNTPALPAGVKYTRVFTATRSTGAVRSDGVMLTWGENTLTLPNPSGTHVASAAMGGYLYCDVYGTCEDWWNASILDNDGAVRTLGDDSFSQRTLPTLPSGSGFLAVDGGFGVHNVGIFGPAYGRSASYCTAGVTSAGCTPLIRGVGEARVSASSPFTLQASNVDGQRTGLIFYGVNNTGFTPLPWASGSASYLCVKAPRQRTAAQNSGGTANACDGGLTLDWNAYVAAHPATLGAPFAAFDRIYAQAWSRDPLAPTGTNLSNALDVPLHP